MLLFLLFRLFQNICRKWIQLQKWTMTPVKTTELMNDNLCKFLIETFFRNWTLSNLNVISLVFLYEKKIDGWLNLIIQIKMYLYIM